jgi:hypothetical protein
MPKQLVAVKLEPKQREWLRDTAERKRSSVSALLRAMVEAVMREDEARRKRMRWLLGDIASTEAMLQTCEAGDILERAELTRRLTERKAELAALKLA